MTQPKEATIEREKDKLFITDAELIRWLGLDPKVARPVIRMLDAQSAKTGFPQKQTLWGGRRYKPALKAWLDKSNGLYTETIRDRRTA